MKMCQDSQSSWGFNFFVGVMLLVVIFLLMVPINAHGLFPIASNPVYPNDYLNHLAAIIQAKMALSEGWFPLRVMPLEQLGWGYPFFQFYSPTSYTIAGLIYQWVTPNDPFLAYKLTTGLALMVGGIYLYRLAYWFFKSRNAALLASVVYLTAPYTICVVAYLGTFNEAVAIGLLPAVVYYSLQRFYYPAQNINLVMAALFWYLLITVHLISFVYTSIFLAILILLLAYKEKRWSSVIAVGFAYVFACLLALWYLGPLLLLEKYMTIDGGVGMANPFNTNSPELVHLLSPYGHFNVIKNAFGRVWFASAQPGLGLPILLGAACCLYIFFSRRASEPEFSYQWMRRLLILFLIILFCVWSPWNFWQWLPHPLLLIEVTQRLLPQVYWVGALLLAWAVTWFFQEGFFKLKYLFVSVALAILATSPWYFGHFTKWMRVSEFLQKPVMDFNVNSYLIYVKKYPYFNAVDSLEMGALVPNGILVPNTQYKIVQSVIKNAYNPVLTLQGYLPSKSSVPNIPFKWVVNGHVAVADTFKAGNFSWEIPLKYTQAHLLQNEDVVISLQVQDKLAANLQIPIKSIVMTGFLNPHKILLVNQVESFCKQQKGETICNLDVPSTTRLVELPVLFYPNLLEVTLNGKPISYLSTLHGHRPVVTVRPRSGARNEIKLKFVGLVWANLMSQVAWTVWLAGCILACQQRFRKS